jgi:hypothetical protein
LPSENLSTNRDETTAKNNAYWLQQSVDTAIANNGGTVVIPSGTYYFCQSDPVETFPDSNGEADIPLILKPSPSGSPVNNVTAYEGFQFTVGSQNLYASQLGRWVVSGNWNSHWLKLVDQYGNNIPGSGVTLSITVQPTNDFAYATLGAGAITLSSNTTYYLVSQEVYAGDSFYPRWP